MKTVRPSAGEMSALLQLRGAYHKLKALGWRDPFDVPADEKPLEVILLALPGIQIARRDSVGFWLEDTDSAEEVPCYPVLCRRPE